MKSDGGDIRVLNSSENTELDYWFDTGCVGNDPLDIYVNFATLPVGDTVIYIYSGNSSATTTKDSGIFDYFEDFSRYSNNQDIRDNTYLLVPGYNE